MSRFRLTARTHTHSRQCSGSQQRGEGLEGDWQTRYSPGKRMQCTGGAVDSGPHRSDKPGAKAQQEKGTDPRIIEQ
jgi:hypothetical protein